MPVIVYPSQETLKKLFAYHITKGGLVWKKPPRGFRIKPNRNVGYSILTIGYRRFKVHTLVWIWHYGDVPKGLMVDHRDRVKSNNRIGNLRLATRSQNTSNKENKPNSSGVKGITWDCKRLLWLCRIRSRGIMHTFRTRDWMLAVNWMHETRNRLHGEFACH